MTVVSLERCGIDRWHVVSLHVVSLCLSTWSFETYMTHMTLELRDIHDTRDTPNVPHLINESSTNVAHFIIVDECLSCLMSSHVIVSSASSHAVAASSHPSCLTSSPRWAWHNEIQDIDGEVHTMNVSRTHHVSPTHHDEWSPTAWMSNARECITTLSWFIVRFRPSICHELIMIRRELHTVNVSRALIVKRSNSGTYTQTHHLGHF